MDRREFLAATASTAAGLAFSNALLPATAHAAAPVAAAEPPVPLKPIGEGKGIHPGRVVWVHDPAVTDWKGPEEGHWWESDRVKQARVNVMMERAVCALTGATAMKDAWDRLFRHHNAARGKKEAGYRPGEKVVIKPNWVGMIRGERHIDLETRTFTRRHDYMNTAPQMLHALLAQLTGLGVRPADITIVDTLACIVNEFYSLLGPDFSGVRFEDCLGDAPGRFKSEPSTTPLYWSCRPADAAQDFVPRCYAEAEYVINFANLKGHTGAGVTLCAKNHYGSLVRTPTTKGFFNMHPGGFAKETGIYRPNVDLIGHAHLGGKTMLNLVDGIFAGIHPKDPVPQRMNYAPFNGNWSCSLFASQDPVAIDSVALDFLQAGFSDYPRQAGVDDYLREAALAAAPPSGTFYDPNHGTPTTRLASLGVHEHWNNPQEKKYSRNLGKDQGIELIAIS